MTCSYTMRNQQSDKWLCERRLSYIIPWWVTSNFLSTSCLQPGNIRYEEKSPQQCWPPRAKDAIIYLKCAPNTACQSHNIVLVHSLLHSLVINFIAFYHSSNPFLPNSSSQLLTLLSLSEMRNWNYEKRTSISPIAIFTLSHPSVLLFSVVTLDTIGKQSFFCSRSQTL